MVIRNYHWLNSASRVLISTCSAPLVQTGERKQFSMFDLDLTLTYNPRIAKVKVDPHAENQGQTVQTGEHPQTNGRTHTHTNGRYQMYYLPCCAVNNDYQHWGASLREQLSFRLECGSPGYCQGSVDSGRIVRLTF